MSLDNNNEYTQNDLYEQRRKKAENFHLHISDDDYGFDTLPSETDELNSYSGEQAREEIARKSKTALKKIKKEKKKELKQKNKYNRRYFRIFWIISVVIVGAMLSVYFITGMNDLLAINRTDNTKVTVEIPENPTVDQIAKTLKSKGIINDPSYFKLYTSVTKSGDSFTQGTYEMSKNMDYEAIINYLLSSNNRTDTVTVMISEGQNVLEIANTLKENGALNDVDTFLELCASDNFDEDFSFLKEIDNADDRYYKLEGYLYPDTYEFYKNEDAESVIYKFLNNFEMRLSEKREVSGYDDLTTVNKLLKNSDYSLDEIMRIASIIQAEAANTEDMYNVSSIIHNRLTADVNLGVSNLGLDSTKYYPYRSASDVPKSEGSDYTSKYDTYSKTGLPAGPICNPGMDTILAAINPNDTGYYYFCHDADGNAYYASTLYEHQMNLEYIQ